jgi:hypothetical protein
MDTIESLYSDRDYCFKEIHHIREAIGTTKATQETFDAAIRSLGFMKIYAPADISFLVDMQISETETRLTYFLLRGNGA